MNLMSAAMCECPPGRLPECPAAAGFQHNKLQKSGYSVDLVARGGFGYGGSFEL